MKAKTVSWAFGLALLVIITGLGWATLAGRLAIVSSSNHKVTINVSGYGNTDVTCRTLTYTSALADTKVVTGSMIADRHSVGMNMRVTDQVFASGGSLSHEDSRLIARLLRPAKQLVGYSSSEWGFFNENGSLVREAEDFVARTCRS